MDAHALVVNSVDRLLIQISIGQLARTNIILNHNQRHVIQHRETKSYETVHCMHIDVASHLVAVARDVPSKQHAQVRKAMEFVEGALNESKPIRLPTLNEVRLANYLISLPKTTVLQGRLPVVIDELIAMRGHVADLLETEFLFSLDSTCNVDSLNGSQRKVVSLQEVGVGSVILVGAALVRVCHRTGASVGRFSEGFIIASLGSH